MVALFTAIVNSMGLFSFTVKLDTTEINDLIQIEKISEINEGTRNLYIQDSKILENYSSVLGDNITPNTKFMRILLF